MTSLKIKIFAALLFITTINSAVIGYGIMIPKYGSWGAAYTAACVSLAIAYVYLFFKRKGSTRRQSQQL
jgi:hypothetical protein